MAIVYFMDYYSHYLLGDRFVVQTEHGSLRWILNIRKPKGQMAQWIERLSNFDSEIEQKARC